jgi:hypothetical protein
VPLAQADSLNSWRRIKEGLTGARSTEYWRGINQSLLPDGADGVWKFTGKLVSATPERNPEELVLAVDGDMGEAKVLVVEALRGSMKPGAAISFSGVAIEYVKQPYTLVLESDPDEIEGWQGQ